MSNGGGDLSPRVSAMSLIEDDRAQVAHEIHDALLPLLFVSHAGVERLIEDLQTADSTSTLGPEEQSTLGPEEQLQRLTQVQDWLRSAMQTGRDLLTRTHPAELTDRSWDSAAIQILAGQFPSATLRWEIDPPTRELPLDLQTAAFRIVTEAVRNSLRHGKASSVDITATIDGNDVCIRIRDDGSGFDPKQVADDRFGIRTMRGRAALVGGSLQFDSKPGGPTSVSFRFRSPTDT